MEEIDLSNVKSKIVSGVFSLTLKSFIIQTVRTASYVALIALFDPSVFGVTAIATSIISIFQYFSDVGFAAALIQKKNEPTNEELSSVFIVQFILVGLIVGIGLQFSSSLGHFYNLDEKGIFLIRALFISFLISSLKSIPSVRLERNLDFGRLVIPQILETISYFGILIILAVYGFGISSFSWASISSSLIGLLSLYKIAPWKPSFSFTKSVTRELLSFGIPFQTQSLLALVKDNLMILFLGTLLKKTEIGFITQSKNISELSLRLVLENAIRVTFPAYSRLQENKDFLKKAIEKSLFFLALFMFPTTLLAVVYIQPAISLLPKYSKWNPAIFSFYLFSFNSLISAFSTTLVNALNAIGKIKITLGLMVGWTLLTWILYPIMVRIYGFNGVAIATFIIAFTGFLPILLLRRYIYFRILNSIYKPLIMAFTGIIPAYFILNLQKDWFTVISSLIVVFLVYFAMVWFWMKEEIGPYLPKFLKKNQ